MCNASIDRIQCRFHRGMDTSCIAFRAPHSMKVWPALSDGIYMNGVYMR